MIETKKGGLLEPLTRFSSIQSKTIEPRGATEYCEELEDDCDVDRRG